MKTRVSDSSHYASNRNASLSEPLVRRYRTDPLLAGFFPIFAGRFDKAASHWIDRPKGIDSHILILCLGGKGWARKGRERFDLERGDWILLKANESHEYGADENDPWTIYWTHFIGRDCARFFQLIDLEKRGIRRRVQDPELLRHLMSNLEEVVASYESGFGFLECLRAAEAFRSFFLNIAFAETKNDSPSEGP
ncbi:MAG: AraC family ligand binding domain-containing protein, partial [Spirochaetia bacterium]|nr:AraC family ligand binding domain-containing protein [Spirochaetia bacterium]